MGKAPQAASGEEKELLALGSGNAREQDSLPRHEMQAGGQTCVTRSLCGEMEAWLLRRHEGTTRAGARAPL